MKKIPAKLAKTNNPRSLPKIVKLNFIAGLLHLGQGIIMLLVSSDKTLPVTLSYITYDESTKVLVAATRHIADMRFAYIPVLFLFMSAAAHFAISSYLRKSYEKDLGVGVNKYRWLEYSLSASIMMVGIAMLAGMYDLGSLVLLFVVTAAMNLMGLVMELWNQKAKRITWLPYILGCIFGVVPWIVVLLYFIGANMFGSGGIPSFVYWIYASLFIFFNCFALNTWLQYRKKGKWSSYLYGEKAYIILSLTAKAALAWQVWAGSLRQ